MVFRRVVRVYLSIPFRIQEEIERNNCHLYIYYFQFLLGFKGLEA